MCVRVRCSCHADYYNRQVRKIKCCPKLSSFIHDVNFMFKFDSIEHLNWYHVELLSKAISRYILVAVWCCLLVYSICYYFGIIWNNLQPFTKKLQRDRLIFIFWKSREFNAKQTWIAIFMTCDHTACAHKNNTIYFTHSFDSIFLVSLNVCFFSFCRYFPHIWTDSMRFINDMHSYIIEICPNVQTVLIAKIQNSKMRQQ